MIDLLDTSAVLAHVRNERGAQQVQALFTGGTATLLLCSVTLAELARRFRDLGATPDEAWETIDGATGSWWMEWSPWTTRYAGTATGFSLPRLHASRSWMR